MSDTVEETSLGAVLQPPANVRRARWLLTGFFAGQGVIMATWATRMPAVKEAAHLTPGALSVALVAASAGMIAMLPLSGRLAERPQGTGRLLVGAALALGTALILLGHICSLPALVATAALYGAGQGLLLVPLNAAGVAIQTQMVKPIMSTLHASYSIGALCAAAVATATATVPHSIVFTVVGTTVIAAALLSAPLSLSLTASKAPSTAAQGQVRARWVVWLLGGMIAAGLIAEGTALDWSAVHVRSLGASATAAAASYWLYSAGMAAGRLMGDTLTAKLGPQTLLRTGAIVAAVGLGAGLAATNTPAATPAALIGWALLGLGLAPVIPLLYTAAGSYGPRAVASISTIGNLGLLGGPVAIGAIATATATSLPVALSVPVILAAALAAASRAGAPAP
ncbi:MFS transporter [Streptacidiphilus sp. EB103A]|uniref:MFS transporter n=1 Tax=Streptacidiphilus sp. EB103A TaxID=3156275 RepID=UPI00351357E6